MSSTFWREWHRGYDDPDSSLSRRLTVVQDQLRMALRVVEQPSDRRLRLISVCAGDGRDVLGVLAEEPVPVDVLLVELDPELSRAAADRAAANGVDAVTVRTADAGLTTSYADHLPADVCLLCGVLGNIGADDLVALIEDLPMLLMSGAPVIWTRGHQPDSDDRPAGDDPSERVRAAFVAAGYQELAFVRPQQESFRVGTHRWTGPVMPYQPDRRLFEFVRHDAVGR
ncbi:hypothetical protein [Microlunatus soli]|uniref:Methyltransferase domain-containing protein n=1 Tax=Microlunatus soli TaxID=630515 RepID=A0A1H2ABL5_9ACTN|nr:hypothetical protein [Microlunatus soli]SDT43274.1 hypothetical protein SAMN04489812_5812 [Microlunatus soli]